MVDWDFILIQIFELGAFCCGLWVCMFIMLRLFITQLSLDVRNFPPRLQGLVMLDSLIISILFGYEDTPYTASIKTGLSLEELKELDEDGKKYGSHDNY